MPPRLAKIPRIVHQHEAAVLARDRKAVVTPVGLINANLFQVRATFAIAYRVFLLSRQWRGNSKYQAVRSKYSADAKTPVNREFRWVSSLLMRQSFLTYRAGHGSLSLGAEVGSTACNFAFVLRAEVGPTAGS